MTLTYGRFYKTRAVPGLMLIFGPRTARAMNDYWLQANNGVLSLLARLLVVASKNLGLTRLVKGNDIKWLIGHAIDLHAW